MSFTEKTNALIHETSPYLLQHAHNPVNWLPWGSESLELAKKTNKLLLVSIGYSACHWCHVMEHESFEDEAVAEIMNAHFICIKIDREERPDIDQVYMDALQLMTGQGGWPLNCICLPDQRPIYGGTYFRKNDWMALLQNLAAFWQNTPHEAIEYATKLTAGISDSGSFSAPVIQAQIVREEYLGFQKKLDGIWMRLIDKVNGGFGGAPKFPLPGSWVFLMRKAYLKADDELMQMADLTLHKMAYGGIYDQLGGGFSRYSTDATWFAPHFEKMLYDNAQLISLYAEAWQRTGLAIYKQVVFESLKFVKSELSAPEGGFYAALDADSEGIEGKFYTWSGQEINSLLGSDADLVKDVFHIKDAGNWESTNILFRDGHEMGLAAKIGLTEHEFYVLLNRCKSRLMIHRATRIRPGLDDKMLASWNALMIKAYADAYISFAAPEYLTLSVLNMNFLLENFISDGQLYRTYKDGKVKILAFLDDYVFTADACLALYKASYDEKWLFTSEKLMKKVLQDFYDPESGMFYYTSAAETLIARKQEVFDTVIPSSSSVGARVLYHLGSYFANDTYIEYAIRMLEAVKTQMTSYAPSFSNWSLLMLEAGHGLTEIAVCGPNAEKLATGFRDFYLPFTIVLVESQNGNNLPLLEGKIGFLYNQIYVCKNKICNLPVTNIADAINLISALRE